MEEQTIVSGNQRWIRLAMDMQSSDSSPPDGEDLPWVKLFSHAFQGPGGWYIENSLTTIGGKDPVGELNRELWNSGTDANKDIVRKQKRKLSFYANIYVVQDKAQSSERG